MSPLPLPRFAPLLPLKWGTTALSPPSGMLCRFRIWGRPRLRVTPCRRTLVSSTTAWQTRFRGVRDTAVISFLPPVSITEARLTLIMWLAERPSAPAERDLATSARPQRQRCAANPRQGEFRPTISRYARPIPSHSEHVRRRTWGADKRERSRKRFRAHNLLAARTDS